MSPRKYLVENGEMSQMYVTYTKREVFASRDVQLLKRSFVVRAG